MHFVGASVYDVEVTAVVDDASDDSSDEDESSEEVDKYLCMSGSRFSSNGGKSPSYSVNESVAHT